MRGVFTSLFWFICANIVRATNIEKGEVISTDVYYDEVDTLSLQFEPTVLKIFENDVDAINVSYTFKNASLYTDFIQSNVFEVTVQANSEDVTVLNNTYSRFVLSDHIGQFDIQAANQSFNQNVSFTVRGVRLGYGLFSFHIRVIPADVYYGTLYPETGEVLSTNESFEYSSRENVTYTYRYTYRVGVMRAPTVQDHVFMGIVLILVAASTISMGCAVDLAVVRDVLKKPIAPAIGFGSQFVIMPLLAFAICKIAGFRGNAGLGFFASGCAPGGGSSNKYTYLVDGDVSLSVTMTLISTLTSLGMIPLWLFTLGQTFIQEASQDVKIKIPFENILYTLVSIIVTVAIGVFFKYKVPKVAAFLLKIIRPMLIFIIIFMFSFGLWANWYIFSLFTPELIIAGMGLPWIGFVLGGVVAAIFRQSWTRIKTIAIETGIQNTGVPIMLLKFSLPAPDGDLAMVAIIAANMFTSIPLWFVVAYLEIKKRCCKKQSDEKEKEQDKEDAEDSDEVLELNPEKIPYLDRETNI